MQQRFDFYGIELIVDPRRALIPRQETELLCERIDQAITTEKLLLDVCAGSGTLGLPLKKRHPQLEVYLSDLSAEALSLAKENAKLNHLDIHFLEGDLLEPFKKLSLLCDLFVCNPPYISEEEYEELDPSVKLIEPKMALLGGKEGLDFFIRLEKELPSILKPGAKLFFEVGYRQGPSMFDIFQAPHWTHVCVNKDYSQHDRFFSLQFEK